jgi:hypothetical protein
LGNIDLVPETFLDFFGGGRFKKQLQGFPEIFSGLLDGVSLAGNIQFRTERHITIPFPFNDGRKLPFHRAFLSFKGLLLFALYTGISTVL